MDTTYDVGEEIFVKGTLKSIVIDKSGIVYKVDVVEANGNVVRLGLKKDKITTFR